MLWKPVENFRALSEGKLELQPDHGDQTGDGEYDQEGEGLAAGLAVGEGE